MQLEGRIKKVFPVQKGTSMKTGNEWRKQEFFFGYFEDPSSIYETTIVLSLMNERIDEYKLQEGDVIKVRIGLSYREHEGRYFNEVRTGAIVIQKRAQPTEEAPQQQQAEPVATNGDPAVTGPQVQQQPANNANDDLPF